MTLLPKSKFEEEWVNILAKGMITIPKPFRQELGIREGEVVRIKKVGRRLVIEPRDLTDYETYGNQEFKKMLKEDKLPKKLALKAASLWSDLA